MEKVKQRGSPFGHVSLRIKVFLALFLMTTFAAGVLVQVSVRQNSEVLLRKTIREQMQNAELAADGVESVMNHIVSLSKLTSLNNSLQQIAGLSDKLERAELYNLEYILKDDLNYLIETSGEVAAITAYFKDERICASSGVNAGVYRRIGQKPIRFETAKLFYTSAPTIVNTRNVDYLVGRPGTNVVTLYRPIISYMTTMISGILQFDVLEDTLSDVFSGVVTTDDSAMLMVDKNGFIIAAPDPKRLFKLLALGERDRTYEDSGAAIYKKDGAELLVIEQPVKGYDWRIVETIPLKSLLAESVKVAREMYLLLLIILLFSLAPIWLLSRAVTRPLVRLAGVMRAAGEGDLTVRADACAKDEVGQLSQVFNFMLERISDLMTRMVEEQKGKRKYEFLAMQEQIKPHFLYNTLDNIHAMIFLKNTDDALRMCKALGQFYRSSLSGGRSLVAVEKELEIVGSYLTIQQMRFHNRFTYSIECESDVRSWLIPKMIVQPLVENAIRHGIRDCDYPGELIVRAYASGDAVVLSVRDNGKGFPEDKRRRLTGGEKIERDGEGFGLASIIDRLRIYYDPICSLEITNHEPGCTVSILIRRKEAA